MKLATLNAKDFRTAAVVVHDEGVEFVDGYHDVGSLLAAGERGLADAAKADARSESIRYDQRDLRLPVLRPGAVFCVGLNYRAHILEMGREIPVHPTLFGKLERTLTGPYDDIPLPASSPEVDYEGELVVVIGRGGREISQKQAGDHIAGYTLMNDVSMRDWQYRTIQWFAGKNFERSTPVGPWIVTPDEIDFTTACIETTVNGELRQQAQLSDLVFDPAALVADISRITRLEPGDLIATGTPGGVGQGMDPRSYLRDGDVVEVTVEGIGTIRSRAIRR